MGVKMKVLHIVSGFPYTKLYKELLDKQIAQGIKLRAYVFTRKEHQHRKVYDSYVDQRFNHTRIDRMIFHVKHKKVLRDIISIYDFGEYDLLHAHTLFSNGYIAYKINERYGIPYVVAIRNTDINVFFKYMVHLRSLGKRILKNASKVIFISEAYRKEALKKYLSKKEFQEVIEKSITIPNGINDFWIENRFGLNRKITGKNLRILCVAEINKNKNQIALAEACSLLKDKGYDVELTLIGEEQSKKIVKQLRAHSFVTFKEHMPKERLIEYYRNNDIFVLPSKHETFGLVYAEALSQGLPVIYTKRQGFDGQFPEGKAGFSVDCNDPANICKKILEVINKYEALIRFVIRVPFKHSWGIIAEEYLKLYKICKK